VSSELVETGLWRWLDGTGLEWFALHREAGGWRLKGTILALHDGAPAEARYEVSCDPGWRTKRAVVDVQSAGAHRSLRLAVENGRWFRDAREQPDVQGCVDVDLSWSPSTNTLPIRRLGLAVGQTSDRVTAAWVRFPELTLEPLPQEYRRLGESRYRYTSRAGAFTAEIDVDGHGLVVEYAGLWERVATRE
jgi:hypothetical protein